MVFGLYGPADDQTSASATRVNGMWMISGPGADLATCTPSKHLLLRCTSTSSGFTLNHLYIALADGTGWTDVASGSASNVRSNPKFIDMTFVKERDIVTASWTESNSSTGDCVDDTDGTTGEKSIKLTTGATSGSRAQITQSGLKQDFGVDSIFQFKARIGTLSSLNLRGGVNCDPVTSADSNTASYSAEICTATNNNWFIRTASGSNKNSSDTTVTATTNRTGVKIEHYATGTVKVMMYIDANTAITSTTTVPTTGQVGANNDVIRFSMKNSTGADRTWFMYDCRLAYTVSDSWV